MGKLITKHNELIESSYRLSLNEARIVFYGISLINPTSKNFPLEYKIDIKAFTKMFNIESKNIYALLKETVMDKFWIREFTFPTIGEKKMRIRWLTGVEYGDKSGYLKVFINPQLKPFLHQLERNFTTYYLDQVSNFKSIYSVRLYEMSIMQIKRSTLNKYIFTIKVEDLKERLDLTQKYKRFSNFRERVLESAKKEINKHSDIKFSYEIIKCGHSPHEIKFTVNKKKEKTTQHLVSKEPQNNALQLSPSTIEKAKDIVKKTSAGWDIYAIEQQFYDYAKKKGAPKDIDKAFIGFVKKKTSKPP